LNSPKNRDGEEDPLLLEVMMLEYSLIFISLLLFFSFVHFSLVLPCYSLGWVECLIEWVQVTWFSWLQSLFCADMWVRKERKEDNSSKVILLNHWYGRWFERS
jgi:hypothetical protein